MLRKIPNYEYRDNSKNTSDSSSGCEDDFDADENYVNDGDEPNGIDSTAATTALNLSPMPHFPPPPDYPPPVATAAARLQTPQRSRYYYYENTNSKNELMNGSRLRVGSLDRDCGYTTDGNEICSQYNNRQNGSSNAPSNGSSSHSANNSFSSTSSSSNSSVVMHKMKMPPQSQMRYPASNSNPNDFESIEIFTTEQEKRFPHKTLASLSKSGKNKMHHHDGIRSACSGITNGTSSNNSSQNINVVEMLEQNLIPCGGSAASFAREAKFHGNAVAEPQVSFINSVLLV